MSSEIPAPAGYAWWYLTSAAWSHLFLIESVPDDEDILTAMCGQPAADSRVKRQEIAPYCPDCLVMSPATELADRLEARRIELAGS
ncbi:hypothetical protein [Lentzea sp. NBRC 105346]|uniref:hypothetical protein n=1 Tax=Lentzea sp. NBRC 105346 TaxID=3032205 RepID=UPI0025522272|nr:hypothetical protein [Lentzea sp. NBRC 105346]